MGRPYFLVTIAGLYFSLGYNIVRRPEDRGVLYQKVILSLGSTIAITAICCAAIIIMRCYDEFINSKMCAQLTFLT
ncbi:MAG: hypothetical protein CMF31_02565 [Kordiimonas sp.]|nr:hypothetical protein [Kordiimonas sp.]